MMNRGRLMRVFWMLVAAALIVPAPAAAQFSRGYRFLEAVKKKEGDKVNEALEEPGSTIINARDVTSGEGALHIVVNRRDFTWLTFLIQKGANVNIRDSRGVTPLQLAANLGFEEGVQLLVDKLARVDEPNDTGETPLISAVHRGNIALMRILLKAGADPNRSDNSGRTARDYAALAVRSSALLAEIEASAKPRGPRAGARPSYGPSL